MPKRVSRFTAAMLVTAIGAIAFVQPVAAYKVVGKTGQTGGFSLTDTSNAPGTHCDYKDNSGGENELNRMTVHAPNVFAHTSQGTQQVGWSFTIQRQTLGPGLGPWQNRVTSRVFKATTNAINEADFVAKEVRVIVPFSEIQSFRYRAIVNLFWYDHSGHVIGTATLRDVWYGVFGAPFGNKKNFCEDYEYD